MSASAVICLDADQKNGAFAMFSAVLPRLKSPDGQRPELRKIDFTQKLARLTCLLPEGIVATCTARPKPGEDICTLLPKEKLSLTGPEAGNWERSTSSDAEWRPQAERKGYGGSKCWRSFSPEPCAALRGSEEPDPLWRS